MAGTVEGNQWAKALAARMMGLRRQFRNVAANAQTLNGLINGLTSAQRDKLIASLQEEGLNLPDLQAELAGFVTLSNSIMSQVPDTPEIF